MKPELKEAIEEALYYLGVQLEDSICGCAINEETNEPDGGCINCESKSALEKAHKLMEAL